jgi:DnaJ-class molecular chaperone
MRTYYVVLGVPPDESAEGIRAAFRDRAKQLHPDRSGSESEDAFRELQQAYQVLSDPSRRRRYDAELHRAERPPERGRDRDSRRSPEPLVNAPYVEPLIPEDGSDDPVSLFRDFQTIRPSDEALRDRLRRNFTGRDVPKAEHAEALTVELELNAEQALRGGTVPLAIPVARECPACDGARSAGVFPCVHCGQSGWIEDEQTVRVRIPPGVRSGSVTELPLDGLGIENLYLRLLVRVTG